MPFSRDEDQAKRWLNRNPSDAGKAMELLQPISDDAIAFHRVHGELIIRVRRQDMGVLTVVGVGHFSPPLHLKYACFHWGIKHNLLNPTIPFLTRLVSVLVSVCRRQIYALEVRRITLCNHFFPPAVVW